MPSSWLIDSEVTPSTVGTQSLSLARHYQRQPHPPALKFLKCGRVQAVNATTMSPDQQLELVRGDPNLRTVAEWSSLGHASTHLSGTT
jgi:hypothetical protein